MPLFHLKTPAHSNLVTSYIIEVATFDPLPKEAIWAVFTFPAAEPISEQFDACGYGGTNSIELFGLGTLVIHVAMASALIGFLIRKIDMAWARWIARQPKFIAY